MELDSQNKPNRCLTRFLLVAALAAFPACTPSVHDLVAQGDLAALQTRIEGDPAALRAQDDLHKTPLHHAVTFEQAEILSYLVEQGADIEARDKTGMRPLHVAAALNREGIARTLLDAGTRIEARDVYGDTPLHVAAMHGATGLIELLVYEGADVMARNDEQLTPAELARKHRRTKIADQLEDHMANRKGITGW